MSVCTERRSTATASCTAPSPPVVHYLITATAAAPSHDHSRPDRTQVRHLSTLTSDHRRRNHRNAITTSTATMAMCTVALLLWCGLLVHLCPTQLVSSVSAVEEDEYSVTSLLPSFKQLIFWRSDEKLSAKSPGSGTGVGEHFSAITNAVLPSVPSNSGHNTGQSHHSWFSSNAVSGESMVDQTTTMIKTRPVDKENRLCHSCRDNSQVVVNEKEEYRQRIEFIKEQILTRLGLKRPPRPRPDIDLNLYMRIAENTISQREQLTSSEQTRVALDGEEEVDKVFILPLQGDHHKAPTFDITTVDTQSTEYNKVIKSIYILVHYNLTENYYHLINDDTDLFITSEPTIVSTVGGNGEDPNDITHKTSLEILSTVSPMRRADHQVDFDTAHWYQYDVTALLTDYTGKTISIHNNNFDILNSVIIIEMTSPKFIRAKRSIDCTDSVSFCCRQHFYVNFTTIGWNNWIFAPAGYNANYCRGKCDLSHARYHHTTVIGKYPAIKLCCSPREMSPISLIYMDDKFNIYQKNLPNMVVESCDCA